MAETKKAGSKRIIDVQHPDKAPAEDNSKPVLVTNRPILQDPMVVGQAAEEESKEAAVAKAGGTVIQPLTAPEVPGAAKQEASKQEAEEPKEAEETEEAEEPAPKVEKTKTLADLDAEAKSKGDPKPGDQTEEESKPEEKPDQDDPEGTPESDQKTEDKVHKDEEAEAERQAKQDEELVKLVDTKQYFLPINSLEKRRSKQVVLGGVLLSLFLIVAWVDIALDAGLVQIGGLKSITHFFSS